MDVCFPNFSKIFDRMRGGFFFFSNRTLVLAFAPPGRNASIHKPGTCYPSERLWEQNDIPGQRDLDRNASVPEHCVSCAGRAPHTCPFLGLIRVQHHD